MPSAWVDPTVKLVINDSTTFLICDGAGDIPPGADFGLYDRDTRFLSACQLRLDGLPPTLLAVRATANYETVHLLTNPALTGAPRSSLGIIRRHLVGEGLHDDLDITNYGESEAVFRLEFTFEADFDHVFDVKRQVELRTPGNFPPGWWVAEGRPDGLELALGFEGRDFSRRTLIRFSTPAVLGNRGAVLEVRLPPRRTWHLCVDYQLAADGRLQVPRYTCVCPGPPEEARHLQTRRQADYAGEAPTLRADWHVLERAYERSRQDLAALRVTGEQLSAGDFIVAAGIPWFLALFGRDSLITAYQTLPFLPDCARGVLRSLARYQGTKVDPETDEEPGKIPHEVRFGQPAGRADHIPRFPYYGALDATPLFIVVLSETFRCTGNLELVRELAPNLLRALEWVDRYGDLDGDGYVEYWRRAPGGLTNQGWKDSWDSVRFRDGRLAEPPIALAEVQGYVYDAKLRAAELLAALGETGRAAELRRQAARLKEQFNRDFWVADRGYYALALDGRKRPVDSLTSNPGHLLWSGIADEAKARAVAARLLSPELFSGWGIRTLATTEAGYNPLSYHNGSVWPHDTSLIAAGLRRYGFVDEAGRLVVALLEAAAEFPAFRLPELFAGYGREEVGFPVPYPTASSPQAWAAGAVMLGLRTLLGLEADVPNRRLVVRPDLPPALGYLELSGLRVGPARLELRVRERGTAAEVEVGGDLGGLKLEGGQNGGFLAESGA